MGKATDPLVCRVQMVTKSRATDGNRKAVNWLALLSRKFQKKKLASLIYPTYRRNRRSVVECKLTERA